MKKFKNLKIWQEGIQMVLGVNKNTEKRHDNKKFGLISQMRQCSVSNPSNIAEGYGRNSDAELNRFLNIASGSSYELETQLIITSELGFIESIQLKQPSEEWDISKRNYKFSETTKIGI